MKYPPDSEPRSWLKRCLLARLQLRQYVHFQNAILSRLRKKSKLREYSYSQSGAPADRKRSKNHSREIRHARPSRSHRWSAKCATEGSCGQCCW
jgi:hypothetical protein